MNILGLIASPSDPASRFRILQYASFLKQHDVVMGSWYSSPTKDSSPAAWTKKVEACTSIDSWRTWNVLQNLDRLSILLRQFYFDAIWQSRMLLPYLFRADKIIQKPVVFDIDDAIWITESKTEVGRAIANAEKVFAGNEYLAEWCKQYSKNVVLIPTTIDTLKYFPTEKQNDVFTIGWIGTPSNFKYLQLAANAIKNFLREYKNARMMVVSSVAPGFFSFDGQQFVFKKWQPDLETEYINEFDIGIMPLTDDEWTRGKCGFKLLQYMACGKPVVASPVGANQKLLSAQTGLAANTETEWFQSFKELQHDKSQRFSFGNNGRKLIETEFNTGTWAKVIASELKSLKS